MLPKALFSALLLGVSSTFAQTVRDDNGGNCIDIKSCRPRCITFRLDRSGTDCNSAQGIFAEQSDTNPWDINEFRAMNCESAGTCLNDKCGQDDLSGNLTIRIAEDGYIGSAFETSIDLKANEERFTFCSIYPCPKDECALPEQMGSELQFAILRDEDGTESIDDSLLILEIALKASFVGSVLQEGVENRFGPLHVEWMDDPTGCRDGVFSDFVPVAPPSDPMIEANLTELGAGLYCEGDVYEPAPLPQTQPPSPAPTAAPTVTMHPTTWTLEELTQIEALNTLYNSTNMGAKQSTRFHNWFTIENYCEFTGVVCDPNGYVSSIDLTNRRLSGSLPTSWESFSELRTLKLVGNLISGTIPSQLASLSQLNQIELAVNNLSGSIPDELSALENVRRLMLQSNNLNGTIPSSLCNLTSLFAFDVSGNVDMHGEIPSCFGTLPLEIFRVENVGLVGEVPPELCSVRNINGLAPNLFGCSGIACPAGSYEPILGRVTDSNNQCLPCLTPSNVIGSTSCMLVEGNTVLTPSPSISMAPSGSPTISSAPSTSAAPSESPSVSFSPTTSPAPSSQPSFVAVNLTPPPTSISEHSSVPSEAPSKLPSSAPTVVATASPTAAPTRAPTRKPTPSPTQSPTQEAPTIEAELTLLFRGVSTKMTDPTEKTDFKRVVKAFLKDVLPQAHVVHSVRIESQSLQEPDGNEPRVQLLSSRRLSAATALAVKVVVTGETTEESSFGTDVVASLKQNYNAFVAQLANEIELFHDVNSSNNKRGDQDVDWVLLVAAVVLSVVAVVTVVVVRQHRRKDRLSPDDGNAGNPEDNKTNGLFSRGKRNTGGSCLSDESSGGWKSEDASDEGDFVNPVTHDNHSINSGPAWTIDHMTEYEGDNMSRTPSTTEQTLV